MKTPDEIRAEHSNRVFWAIQTVFGVLLARSLFDYQDTVLDPLSSENLPTALALLTVYVTALLSWIDFSFSTIVSPYDLRRNLEKIRFFVDLLIVSLYAFLLFSLRALQADPGANISKLFYGLSAVFFLYLVSGLLRILEHGKRTSRWMLIAGFWLGFLVIARTYSWRYPLATDRWALNVTFIAVAFAVTLGYRTWRGRLASRGGWIAVDVDGVLADQIVNLLPVLKREHGVDLTYDDIKEWDLKVGGTDIATVVKGQQTHKGFVQSMPPIEGAAKGMERLIRKNHVAIVTSRDPASDAWTRAWLRNNGIPYDAYVNAKEGAKHNTDIDHGILIDDYIGNVRQYLEKSDGKAILYSQPWNLDRGALGPFMNEGRLLVAHDWKEVLERVDEMRDQ